VSYRERRPITFASNKKNAKLELNQSRFISIKLKGHDTNIDKVSLDTVGSSVYMSLDTASGKQLAVVCDVE
jgi:hypothetical protein